MPHITRFITAFASVAALACSAAEEPGTGEISGNDQGPSEVSEGLVVNEVTLAGESIQFIEHEAGTESPVFLLHDTASAYVKQTLLERLEAEAGELTLLETFYALAPAGSTAHPDLVRFHAEQVVSLGRADASVQHVTFDVNRPVEKSASACDSFAAANAPSAGWDPAANNQANMQNGGSVGRLCRAVNGLPGCDKLTMQGQFVGTCNDGPADVIVLKELRTNSKGWTREKYAIRLAARQRTGWSIPATGDFARTQTLAITNTDEPDFVSPSYYIRARATRL